MASRKTIRIKFQKNGEGLLECSGYLATRCLGMAGLRYPSDSTIDPTFP